MNSSIATRSAMYRNPVSVCITLDCGYPFICVMIEYAGAGISVSTVVLFSLLLTCGYPSICVMIEYAGTGISVSTVVLFSLLLTCVYPSRCNDRVCWYRY